MMTTQRSEPGAARIREPFGGAAEPVCPYGVGRTSWLFALVAVCGAVAAAGTRAQADPASLVRRSEAADTRVDYSGTKVIRSARGSGRSTRERVVRIFHRAPDQTRLDFVSGGPAGASIIQHGSRHYWRSPQGDVHPLFPHDTAAGRVDLLLQNYTPRKLRVESIAGRRAFVIAIEPKRSGNPKKTIWLDPWTGLALKTQFFNSSGDLTEESFFQDIDLHPTFSPGLFELPPGTPPPPEPPTVQPDFVPKRPGYVPPGYLLVSTGAFMDRSGRTIAYMRYTDGLNTLHVYESRSDSGGRQGWGHELKATGVAGDIRFGIMGDISSDELNRMAESLRK
jgi:outer membrane lipoprotein-sorting protein